MAIRLDARGLSGFGAVARPDGCAYIRWMPPTIESYHAHIYYDVASTRDKAERLRERIGAAFPAGDPGTLA